MPAKSRQLDSDLRKNGAACASIPPSRESLDVDGNTGIRRKTPPWHQRAIGSARSDSFRLLLNGGGRSTIRPTGAAQQIE